jgi:hypothetical protein
MVRRCREAFAVLHRAAGLLVEVRHDEAGGQQQMVLHVGRSSEGQAQAAREWAYLWTGD